MSATAYTLGFVRDSLPKGSRSILEVGCGDGALAVALMGEGYDVLAIGNDGDCVKKARALGVNAMRAE